MRTRSKKGHTTIELATISLIFVTVSVLCLDIGVLILGSGSNERACRDAARAAAQAQDAGSALLAAQAACAAHAQQGGYFATPPTVKTTNFLYEDFGSNNGNPPPGPVQSPYVRVTTMTDVTVPAPIVFMGLAQFGGPGNNQMHFEKTYTFPIVRAPLYL